MHGCTCDWAPVTKGVAWWSVLGPVFFNFFLNDIFVGLNIYNHADDNNLKATANEVKKILIYKRHHMVRNKPNGG